MFAACKNHWGSERQDCPCQIRHAAGEKCIQSLCRPVKICCASMQLCRLLAMAACTSTTPLTLQHMIYLDKRQVLKSTRGLYHQAQAKLWCHVNDWHSKVQEEAIKQREIALTYLNTKLSLEVRSPNRICTLPQLSWLENCCWHASWPNAEAVLTL